MTLAPVGDGSLDVQDGAGVVQLVHKRRGVWKNPEYTNRGKLERLPQPETSNICRQG